MREIEILLTDSEIEPKEIRVPAHETVRLLVINFSEEEHYFAVEGGGDAIQIDHLKPGQTRVLEHVFAEAGSFRTACNHGHNGGPDLSGSLVVEA